MSLTIAARQQRLRENLERLPVKASELHQIENEITEDEGALSQWAQAQKTKALRYPPPSLAQEILSHPFTQEIRSPPFTQDLYVYADASDNQSKLVGD